MKDQSHPFPLIAAMIIMGILVAIPLILYAAWIAPAPAVAASIATQWVREKSAVLVDIGAAPELADKLKDTTAWPLKEILRAQSTNDVPESLRGKKLALVCSGGIHGARASLHLQKIGVNAFNVRGGAQQLLCAVPGCSRSVLMHLDPSPDSTIPAFRESPLYEQWAVVAAFFGIKGIYSLLALVITGLLWKRKETDLAALRWSMIFFFLGEGCCFLNVMVFFEDSLLLEHLHSAGMVLSLGAAFFALLEGVDQRLTTSAAIRVVRWLDCAADATSMTKQDAPCASFSFGSSRPP